MKQLYFFLLFCFFAFQANAQRENDVWVFGYDVGVDFSSGTATSFSSDITTNEGVSAISDEDGELMFYSNGNNVWNADFDVMPSGASLIPTDPSSSSQACVIVPMPGSDSLYYVFSLEIVEYVGTKAPGRLYYSIVDMTLDGGLGDVVAGSSGILLDSAFDEKMVTVAGDCNNVWVLVHSRFANEYYAFEVTEEGISDPVVSVIGDGTVDRNYGKGVLKASHDGTRLAAALGWYNDTTDPFDRGESGLEMYSFDRVTGVVSDRLILVGEDSDYYSFHSFYGVCFSPNDSVLYASSQQGAILQYDLSSSDPDDILASETNVSTASFQFGDMQTAPDGKIYIAQPISSSLHTIEEPNVVGTGCDFSTYSLTLSGLYCYFGLQNLVTPPVARVDTNEIAVHDTVTCALLRLGGREGATSYLWNTGATTDSITITGPGTYWVRSKNGCFSMDTFHVIQDVLEPPVITTRDTTICSPSTAMPLSATVENRIGTTYAWTPLPAIVSGATDSVVIANPSANPVFYLTATNHSGICSASASDSIEVYTFVQAAILTPDTTICSGSEIALQAFGPDFYTYQWSPETGLSTPSGLLTFLTGVSTTDYVLTSTFEDCEGHDTVRITVEPVPLVNIGNDTSFCDYDTVHFYADLTPADFPYYTFDWHPGIYMDDSTIINPVFQTLEPYSGPLSVIVTTPAGCTATDTIRISVGTSAFMLVNPTDTGVCPPALVQLNASNAISYQWLPDYGLSADTIGNPIASPVTTTEYLVMGTSAEGCVDSQYVTVRLYPNAVVYLPDSVSIYPGESYQIEPGGNASYFSWFPSSGLSASNIANPIASPEVRTRYFYTATTEYGCTMLDSIDVLVKTESVLDMPNAFVPGNGANNIFKASKRGIATLNSFAIFNRWGNKVFETQNIDQGWDGSFNGTPQPAGVYIYTIEAVTSTGRPFTKQGNVTLLR